MSFDEHNENLELSANYSRKKVCLLKTHKKRNQPNQGKATRAQSEEKTKEVSEISYIKISENLEASPIYLPKKNVSIKIHTGEVSPVYSFGCDDLETNTREGTFVFSTHFWHSLGNNIPQLYFLDIKNCIRDCYYIAYNTYDEIRIASFLVLS